MKTITFFNLKGGVGKTTIAVNLAYSLEKYHHKKVLLVDCDGQANCSDYVLPDSDSGPNISDYIQNDISVQNIIRNTFIENYRGPVLTNVDIISAKKRMETLLINNESLFKKMLEEVSKKYDYCFIDCPPSINDFTLCSLIASDYVIVPALADTDSLGGYGLILDTINEIRNSQANINLSILGILFNNVNKSNALDKHILQTAKESMGDNVFSSYIRKSSLIGQARYFGKPLVYYKNTAPIIEDYMNLSKEILKKIKKESR